MTTVPRVLQTRCPRCDAAVGEMCKKETGETHADRDRRALLKSRMFLVNAEHPS